MRLPNEKSKAIYLLHQEGMRIREINRRLKVSRNTVRTIIRHKGAMRDSIRKDKIRIDSEILQRLYAECDGRIQRCYVLPSSRPTLLTYPTVRQDRSKNTSL